MRKNVRMRRHVSLLAARERTPPAHTLVIACDELKQYPDLERTAKLGNIAIVQTPANTVTGRNAVGGPSDLSNVIATLHDHIKLKHIVVHGHTNCGYIQALVRGQLVPVESAWTDSCSSITDALAKNAYSHLPVDQQVALYVQHHVSEQLYNLSLFQPVKEAMAADGLKLVGWIYDNDMDWISLLDSETGLFIPANAHVLGMNDRTPPHFMTL